tara:strand:+ start:3684 stop:4079 length:396 start_codon:yes stop_codon:yes gene_type:complete
MHKRGMTLLLVFSLVFLSSFVVAAIEDFDNCEDYCSFDYWTYTDPFCPGEEDTTGIYPDCECGWECYDDVDDKICCQYPGPDDGALYEWRSESDCQSPEGAIFAEEIVSDDLCKDDFKSNSKLEECRHIWS